MKFFSALLLAVCTITCTVYAASDGKAARPLVMVFPLPGNDKDQTPCDPEIVSVVTSLLAKNANVDTMVFNRDHPTINRAVLEGKIRSDVLAKPWEPGHSAEIARGAGATYGLRIQGSVDSENVHVSLELYKVPSGGRWVAEGASKIASGLSGMAATTRKNAITTAASSAVSRIVILAFGGAAIERLIQPEELAPVSSDARETKAGPRNIQAEHDKLVKESESYFKKGDLNNAVCALRRAVNLMPGEAQTRVKLADAYWKLGMSQEAIDECIRGLLFSKDSALYSALAQYYTTTGDLDSAANEYEEIVRLNPDNIDARLDLGDLYWNQGKIEQAAAQYEEAARLAPQNPAPHEKLYKLYGARYMYDRALQHLVRAREASSGKDLTQAEKFSLLAQVIYEEWNSVLGKLKTVTEQFDGLEIGREDYYRECKNVDALAEGLANFVASQVVAEEFKSAYSHAVLATSLLSQSTASLLSYLETDKGQYAQQAELLQSEAKTEMNNFRQAIGKF